MSEGCPPSVCALAKLSSLVGSLSRDRKYNLVRAPTRSVSQARARDFNGNKSVNKKCDALPVQIPPIEGRDYTWM